MSGADTDRKCPFALELDSVEDHSSDQTTHVDGVDDVHGVSKLLELLARAVSDHLGLVDTGG